MLGVGKFFVCGVLCVFGAVAVQGVDHKDRHYRDATPRPTEPYKTESENCDVISSVEGRLERLQSHLDDKFNGLRRDVWSSSRTIEQQTSATKAALEGYRNEVRTDRDRLRRNQNQLQPGQPDQGSQLEREVQLAIVALRVLSNDIAVVKQNLSDIATETSAIREKLDVDQNIQQIFHSPPPSPTDQQAATQVPTSCLDIKKSNSIASNSVYLIQPKGSAKPFMVYCVMDVQEGGWLTVHNRFSGEQDFYRDWQDYRVGFGNIAGEHWLGLERLYEITGNEIHELLIKMVDVNNANTYALYSHFSIGSEEEGYSLKLLGGYRGDAGDSLSYHAGSKFSTKDKDQDSWVEGHCAQSHGGAWWYNSCDKSNLNGRYLPGDQPDLLLYQPMYWSTFAGPKAGLKYAMMMVRPRQQANSVPNMRY